MKYNITVKEIKWDEIKNVWLQENRGISFEEILEDIKTEGGACKGANFMEINKTVANDANKHPDEKVHVTTGDTL
jgi:hypothetical protein